MSEEILKLNDKQYGVAYTPATVDFPEYEQLKTQVDSLNQEFMKYDVTPENLKSAKVTRAKLNKFAKAVNSKKIAIVKEADAPINKFQEQIKELLSKVKEASEHINDQIKTYEDNAKKERHNKNIQDIKRLAKEAGLDPQEALDYILPVYNSCWDNQTASYKKFEEEINQRLQELINRNKAKKEAYEVIEAKADELSLLADNYIESYIAGKTLKEVLSAMQHERNYLNALAKMQAETKKKEQLELKKHGDKAIDPKTGEVKDKVYTVALEIKATKYQLEQLNSFIKDWGIEAKRVK